MAQKISVQIVGDERDLRRAFRSAEDSSKSFADRFRRDGEIITNWAKRGAQAIGVLVATVVGISLKGGIDRLMGLERANRQLEQLGVTADDADGLMESLLDTLRGTPFALEAGAQSLAGFVASGRDLEDIPRLIQQVTDAAAFGNTTLEEVDFLWQRIQTTGRVTNEELRMLAERNIPVYTQLAAAIGVGADEIFKMAERGELGADLFFDAWQRAADGTEEGTVRIAGAAQAMGETTEGAWRNMRTAMSRFGATLLEDVFPLAREVFEGISEGFDRMGAVFSRALDNVDTSSIEEFAARIPELMEGAAEGFIDLWQSTELAREGISLFVSGSLELLGRWETQALAIIGAVALALRGISKHPIIASLIAVGTAVGAVKEHVDRLAEPVENAAEKFRELDEATRLKVLQNVFDDETIRRLEQAGFRLEDIASGTIDLRDVVARSGLDIGETWRDVDRAMETTARGGFSRLGGEMSQIPQLTDDASEGLDGMGESLTEAEQKALDYEEAIDSLSGATDRSFSEMASDVEGFLDGFSELPEETETTLEEFETNFRERAEAMERFWSGLGLLASMGLDSLVDELIREGPGAVDVVDEYINDPTRARIMNSYIEGAEQGLTEAQKTVSQWPDIDGPNVNFGANLPTFSYPDDVGPGDTVRPTRGSNINVRANAEGGIVKATPGGSLFLRGEAGDDEAVIPFDQRGIRILAEVFKQALGGVEGLSGNRQVTNHFSVSIESTGDKHEDAELAGAQYSVLRRMETMA